MSVADLPDLQLQANLGGENVCKASLESGRGLGRGEEAVLLEELHDQSAALVQRAAQGRIGNLIVLQLPQNVVPIGTGPLEGEDVPLAFVGALWGAGLRAAARAAPQFALRGRGVLR